MKLVNPAKEPQKIPGKVWGGLGGSSLTFLNQAFKQNKTQNHFKKRAGAYRCRRAGAKQQRKGRSWGGACCSVAFKTGKCERARMWRIGEGGDARVEKQGVIIKPKDKCGSETAGRCNWRLT